MKSKIFYIFAVFCGITFFWSCKNEVEQITMTTLDREVFLRGSLAPEHNNSIATVIIDWGDGTIESADVSKYGNMFDKFHKYADEGTKIITVTTNFLALFNCSNNQLSALDVSKCTALTELYCQDNQLTALDVSKNKKLSVLWCSNNQLVALDVSKDTKLTKLWCNDNFLTALDVSNNTKLDVLLCQDNQLVELDVSKNIELAVLWCSKNQLAKLDVSNNMKLNKLSCYSNQITQLNVSKNINLTELWCSSNPFTTFDVSNSLQVCPKTDTSLIAFFPLDTTEIYPICTDCIQTELIDNELDEIEFILKELIDSYNIAQEQNMKIYEERYKDVPEQFDENRYLIDLNRYKRQYIAFINSKGEKEVWINCFCNNDDEWKTKIVTVLDGGNCYFNLKINLTTKKWYDFGVNGVA